MATKKTTSTESNGEIRIAEISRGTITVCVVGTTPLIMHRLSSGAAEQLLLPSKKKNASEKESTLKHDPYREFLDSAYKDPSPDAAYRLRMMSTAFKAALRNVAIDAGAKKAQVGRLTYVNGEYSPVGGTPKIMLAITRNSDINKTPDVRTRLVVPEWACVVSVTYIKPLLREQTVVDLLAAAGIMQGIGDWRVAKGSGNFGQFRLASVDDPEFVERMKIGRVQQDAAMQAPEPYDEETREMLNWFDTEARRRGFKVAA